MFLGFVDGIVIAFLCAGVGVVISVIALVMAKRRGESLVLPITGLTINILVAGLAVTVLVLLMLVLANWE